MTQLRFLSKAFCCCIVKTATLTCAWRHRKENFYTLFIRGVTNNWLGVFPVPFLILKREEWEVAGWSTDLNLKGCAVIGRGESGQLYNSSLLSIHDMTAAGECIQSEALNVDTPTVATHSLTLGPTHTCRLMWFVYIVSHISQRVQWSHLFSMEMHEHGVKWVH